MEKGNHRVYEFGAFQRDPVRQHVLRHGQPLPLASKLFETLLLMVENRERILSKEEMMQALIQRILSK